MYLYHVRKVSVSVSRHQFIEPAFMAGSTHGLFPVLIFPAQQ